VDGNAQHTLDLRGSLTSMGLLKASRKFQDLEPGETLIVECDDPALREDILNILDSSQVKAASCEERAEAFRLCIVKQHRDPQGPPPLSCGCGE
jgi:TusA-related sulfurtransferase